ncbi:hypothetical protein KAR04_02805 [Candidatus Calescamantes bacterium]|nr:hypothetical protein [Candidatus Calescamantes bacterium]
MKRSVIFIMALLISVCIAAMGSSNVFNIDPTSGARGSGSVLGVDIDDFGSMLVNPALMPISGWNYFKTSYRKYYEEMDVSLISTAVYLENFGNVGISAIYGNWGYQDSRDATGAVTGQFHSSDLGLVLSFGDAIGQNTYAGVNIKYLFSRIDTYTADSFLVDLGLAFKMKKLLIGLFVNNWGTKLEYVQEGAFPSMSGGIGFRYKRPMGDGGMSLTLLTQAVIRESSMILNSGFAFNINKWIKLRFGASDALNDTTRNILFGAQIGLNKLEIDVSYGFGSLLPGTVSAGLGYRW